MRPATTLAGLFLFVVGSLPAQSADWGRITVGLSIGLRPSSSLWDVPSQTVVSSNQLPSSQFHLHRDIRGGITIAAQAAFYSSPKFGLTFELGYLGMGLSDACTLVHDGGDSELRDACTYVGSSQKFGQGIDPQLGYHDAYGIDHSASATLVQAGVILRPFKPAALQPFFKAMLGIATTPHSTVRMESLYGEDAISPWNALNLIVYEDYGWKHSKPVFTGAIGLTTAPSSGLQAHLEARGSFLPQSIVDGATTTQNQVPQHHTSIRGHFSVLIGLEVVLKRERGKRY